MTKFPAIGEERGREGGVGMVGGWKRSLDASSMVQSSSRNVLRTYDAEGGYNLCFWFCLPCSEALHHLQLVSLPKAAWNSLASRGTISEALILYIHLLHRLRKREREEKIVVHLPAGTFLARGGTESRNICL